MGCQSAITCISDVDDVTALPVGAREVTGLVCVLGRTVRADVHAVAHCSTNAGVTSTCPSVPDSERSSCVMVSDWRGVCPADNGGCLSRAKKGWDWGMRKMMAMFALASAVAVWGSRGIAQTPKDTATIDDIRTNLLRLPSYGVFDFLAFTYDKGTAVLGGYAYHPSLKVDAERAVKQVARVDQVINRIEDLPVSSNDDDLRWKTRDAIYADPFLSRYAPGGGMLWGHRHPVPFSVSGSPARFRGLEPIGKYPIVVIVKNGRITLMGSVDSEADKTMAGIKAEGVSASFGVENELTVETLK